MIFDLDRHKVRVMAEVTLTAAWNGALPAILVAWIAPDVFNIFTADGWRRLLQVAGMGAALGIRNLLSSLPRNVAVVQDRRSDHEQVEKAATKLVEKGEIPPIVPKP